MGGKRITIDIAKKAFSDRGYELLSNEYINSDTKMEYRCPKHPDKHLSMKYSNLKSGKGCPYCANRGSASYEEVKNAFEQCGYELLETEYSNCITKLRYKCPKHPDKQLSISYARLKQGNRCPYCSKVGKHTLEDAKQIFAEHGLVLLEDHYERADKPMLYSCLKHPDKEQKATLSDVMNRGIGCPHCSGKAKPTIDEVSELFRKRGYELLEHEYINNETPMRYKCPHHPDKELYVSYGSFKSSNSGCPYCAGVVRYTLDEARQFFADRGYVLLSKEYINGKQKLSYVCPNHPYKELNMSLSNLLAGKGCPYCAGNAKYTIDDVRKVFSDRGYILLEDEYHHAHSKLRYQCPDHPNEELSVTLSSFIHQESGCPLCNESKGERKVYQYLVTNNFNYKAEYRIPECKDAYTLPFDFAIFNEHGDLTALIEYDGKFHYEPAGYSKDKQKMKDKLSLQQRHDRIKKMYCQEHSIRLINIPYWDYDNVESILDKELKKYD